MHSTGEGRADLLTDHLYWKQDHYSYCYAIHAHLLLGITVEKGCYSLVHVLLPSYIIVISKI